MMKLCSITVLNVTLLYTFIDSSTESDEVPIVTSKGKQKSAKKSKVPQGTLPSCSLFYSALSHSIMAQSILLCLSLILADFDQAQLHT